MKWRSHIGGGIAHYEIRLLDLSELGLSLVYLPAQPGIGHNCVSARLLRDRIVTTDSFVKYSNPAKASITGRPTEGQSSANTIHM